MKKIKIILISSILVFSLDVLAAETGSQKEPPTLTSMFFKLINTILGDEKK
ncbi:hypothetical protein GCM10008107_14500 [Psychrosphaera saromensis]|uniref:hypothetical protein n=1 Tax=Psychrosphaera saromensis TaxID=716813 RepID=UPI001675CEC4|nr:hypothetical protein [Psychrosphaera saromensis]GHB66406.1 hypothetical protein GCM10008107_14500 [Psychrosphaera saromensis]GLQ14906.1 hypothetical protein GCM10007917_23610 [Psychrosphaera saromensis]